MSERFYQVEKELKEKLSIWAKKLEELGVPEQDIEWLCKLPEKVSDIEEIGLKSLFYRIPGRRGRPPLGKYMPYAYALLVLLKRRGFKIKARPSINDALKELGEKYGIEVKPLSEDTISARFEELMANPLLQDIVNLMLEYVELAKKHRRRLKVWDYRVFDEIMRLLEKGEKVRASELVKELTDIESLRKYVTNIILEGRRGTLKNIAKALERFILYFKGWSPKEIYEYLEAKKRGKARRLEVLYLEGDEIDKFKNEDYLAETFVKFMNDMVKYYTTDTIRQSLTVLWAMVPSLKQHPYLRGLHAKLKRKGVKKNDAHVIYPEEFKLLMEDERLSEFEKLVLATHITLGCREGREEVWIRGKKVRGGLLGLDWSNVHWEGGLPKSVDVFETKAKGGIWWLNVKLDLFFKWLPHKLKEYWESQGRPREGRIFPISYSKLLAIYKKVRKILNEYREQGLSPTMAVSELTPHDARRTHAMWLILADVPFEVIAGGLRGEKINSPLGVLWITDITLVEYYADLMPKALKSVELVEKWASKVFT